MYIKIILDMYTLHYMHGVYLELHDLQFTYIFIYIYNYERVACADCLSHKKKKKKKKYFHENFATLYTISSIIIYIADIHMYNIIIFI